MLLRARARPPRHEKSQQERKQSNRMENSLKLNSYWLSLRILLRHSSQVLGH
jgi:hypothetical protein